MKKMILTGVVLLLLIILGVDIYNDHKRANDQKEQQAAAPAPGNSATAGAAALADMNNGAHDMNDEISPATGTSTTTVAAAKHRKIRRGQNMVPADESWPSQEDEDAADGVTVITDEGQTSDVSAQKASEFTGNMPVKKVAKVERGILVTHRHLVHFAPEVGIMENEVYDYSGSKMQRTGFYAGGILDIGLGEHFALQPGIKYALKGFEVENITRNSIMVVDTKDKVDLHYLVMPVDLVVKFGDRENVRIMVGAGPYISYLLKAQDRYATTTTTLANTAARTTTAIPGPVASSQVTYQEGQYNLPVGNDNGTTTNASGTNGVRTLDWGINGFVGCETPGGFYAKAGSEVGLSNDQHNVNGTTSGRNLNFFVSLGYLIGNKK